MSQSFCLHRWCLGLGNRFWDLGDETIKPEEVGKGMVGGGVVGLFDVVSLIPPTDTANSSDGNKAIAAASVDGDMGFGQKKRLSVSCSGRDGCSPRVDVYGESHLQ